MKTFPKCDLCLILINLTTNQNAALIIDHLLEFTNNDNDNANKKTCNKRHKIINDMKTGKRIMLRIFG